MGKHRKPKGNSWRGPDRFRVYLLLIQTAIWIYSRTAGR